MRKLIRRSRQQDFATQNGHWTLDVAEAMEFPDLILITADLRKVYGPDDIELYYAFGEHAPTEFDFCQGSAASQAA